MENMETATKNTLNGLFLTEDYDDMAGEKEVGRLNIPGATFEGNTSGGGGGGGVGGGVGGVGGASIRRASNTGHSIIKRLSNAGDGVASSGSGHNLNFGGVDRRRSVMIDNCDGIRKIKTGTTKNLVAKFMENIPETEKKQGATYRQKQLLHQLPAHDIDGKACKTLMTEDEKQEMEEFRHHRQQHALGQGLIYTIGQKRDAEDETKDTDGLWDCEECSSTLKKGETAIFTEKTGPERCWHGKCFVCFTCKELLVDLIYFHKDEHVYCGRHHAELVKPRCKACDELIFTGEYTHAEEADWHIVHFCCWKCDELLGGKRYISREGHPFCLSCFDKEFGKKCSTCHKPIAADESHLTHKDMTWHGNDECFTCQTCKTSLVGKPFLPRLDHIFCSRNCYKSYKEAQQAS